MRHCGVAYVTISFLAFVVFAVRDADDDVQHDIKAGHAEELRATSDASQVLRVAVLTPTECKSCKQNAEDACTGWTVWLSSTDMQVELPDGSIVAIETDMFPYENGNESLKAVAEQIDPGKYHVVIGTSFHFLEQVLEVMQEKRLLNIQCDGGNPDIWSALARTAEGQLYGFGMHSSFKQYPGPFLKQAAEQLRSNANLSRPKVALVRSKHHNLNFQVTLCESAKEIAEQLGMDVSSYDDFTDAAAFLDTDILYGCTGNLDGMELMRVVKNASDRRPLAISIAVAPSKIWFKEEFLLNGAFVSYPAQWHFTDEHECSLEFEGRSTDYCPKFLKSGQDFSTWSDKLLIKGDASYNRASCTAAGVALETAMQTLKRSDFDAEDSLSLVQRKLFDALANMSVGSFFGKIQFDKVSHMSMRETRVIQYVPDTLYTATSGPCTMVKEVSLLEAAGEQEREVLDVAIAAVEQASKPGGFNSEWTKALAGALQAEESESLGDVLRRHGWIGTQFSRPPTLKPLLDDLLKVKEGRPLLLWNPKDIPTQRQCPFEGGRFLGSSQRASIPSHTSHFFWLAALLVALTAYGETSLLG